jgi:Arc/MetJ family transcription regulator
MRTNIEIDNDLISQIMQMLKARNKRLAIEQSLRNYTRYLSKLELVKLRGKVQWEGNLDEMRSI